MGSDKRGWARLSWMVMLAVLTPTLALMLNVPIWAMGLGVSLGLFFAACSLLTDQRWPDTREVPMESDERALRVALAEALGEYYAGPGVDGMKSMHYGGARVVLDVLDAARSASSPSSGPDFREALVVELEKEGVVTWADEGHRQRFLSGNP